MKGDFHLYSIQRDKIQSKKKKKNPYIDAEATVSLNCQHSSYFK